MLPPLEYKTNGRLAAVNIKEDDIYLKNIKNLNPKKLMDGTTYQLGWFNFAEKLLWKNI